MKKIRYKLSIIFRRIGVITLIVAAILPHAVYAQERKDTQKQAIQQPQVTNNVQLDKNGVLILIRSVLFTLDLANKTGNYSVLRDIGAPGFAATNDSLRLSEAFKKLREDKIDLSGVLVYEPTLTLQPSIDKDGFLRMGGFFPSPTSQINFELMFAPVNGRWRIMGFSANVGPSGPLAPMTFQNATSPAMNVNQNPAKR